MMNYIPVVKRETYPRTFLWRVNLFVIFTEEVSFAPDDERLKEILSVQTKQVFARENDLIALDSDNIIYIISGKSVLITVSAADYKGFENFSKNIPLLKNILECLGVKECQILFSKINRLNFGSALKGKKGIINLAKELMSKDYMSCALISGDDGKSGKYTLVQNDNDVVIVGYTFLTEKEDTIFEMQIDTQTIIRPLEIDLLKHLKEQNDDLFFFWHWAISDALLLNMKEEVKS